MALKPVTASRASFLDPVLLPGKESLRHWRRAIDALPAEVGPRILAFVSDGFCGSKTLARGRGWTHQRCHFHLIAQLQARRGRRKPLAGAAVREATYHGIRERLASADEAPVEQLREQLRHWARGPECPKRFRMLTQDFLRDFESFRAYRRYPHWDLATTTNVIEAMAHVVRQRLRTLKTPGAVQRWATAIIRLRPWMVCNGQKDQPN